MLPVEGAAVAGEMGRPGRIFSMAETVVDAFEAASTNGGTDVLVVDPKATVLARDDALSGKLTLKGPGQVLGNFSGQIECDGDLIVGTEAHVEADIRGA